MTTAPTGELDARYSDEQATTLDWASAVKALEAAELFWLSTARAGGRLHVTPLIAVWHAGALHFCTGPDKQKARNLRLDDHCALTTGTNIWNEGLDMVVEGQAVRVSDDADLTSIAAAFVAKYGSDWSFEVRDGCFFHGGGSDQGDGRFAAWVFRVDPISVYAFAKGPFAQTRWQQGL